jgi:hypothetical protein
MIENKNRIALKGKTIDYSRIDKPEAEMRNYKRDSPAKGLQSFQNDLLQIIIK